MRGNLLWRLLTQGGTDAKVDISLRHRRRHRQHGTHRQGRPGPALGPHARRHAAKPGHRHRRPTRQPGTCTHRALPDCALRLPRHPILRGRDDEPPHHHPSPPRLPPPRQCPDLQCRLWRPGQTAGDYKALVCVFLVSGNDGHNMLVPMEAKAYAAYRGIRAAWPCPMARRSCSTSPHRRRALWPQLRPHGDCAALGSGLAAVAMSDRWPPHHARSGAGRVGSLPSNLLPLRPDPAGPGGQCHRRRGTGWAGRTADALVARNGSSRFPAAISTHGNALFCTGAKVASASLIPGFDLSTNGMNVWPDSAAQARAKGLAEVLTLDQGVSLIQAANRVRQDAQTLSQLLRSGGSATLGVQPSGHRPRQATPTGGSISSSCAPPPAWAGRSSSASTAV